MLDSARRPLPAAALAPGGAPLPLPPREAPLLVPPRRPLRAAALAAGAAALATAAGATPAGAAPARSGSDHARTTLPKQIVPARGSGAVPRALDKAARASSNAGKAGKAASNNGFSYHGG